MKKKTKYKLPPNVIPLFEHELGKYHVIGAWREKPRAFVNFYFDGVSNMPATIGDIPAYDIHGFKKL